MGDDKRWDESQRQFFERVRHAARVEAGTVWMPRVTEVDDARCAVCRRPTRTVRGRYVYQEQGVWKVKCGRCLYSKCEDCGGRCRYMAAYCAACAELRSAYAGLRGLYREARE